MDKIQVIDHEWINRAVGKNDIAGLYLASLSKGSRRTMEQALDVMSFIVAGVSCDMFPWDLLRYKHVVAIRERLANKYKPASVNKMLCALRGVLKQAYLSDEMKAEDYQKVIQVKGVKSETLPSGRALSIGEITALLKTCVEDSTPAGIRDGAIIAVLYGSGLRRAELVELNMEDYNQDTGELVVRGKGNKERLAHLRNGSSQALTDWLDIRGDHPGAIFNPVVKGGKIQNRNLTAQAVYYLLKKRGTQAGIKEFSPHDLRRTFITHLLEAGARITTVSKMAGHAKIETTSRYDMSGEEAKVKASELLHVPYHR